MSRDICRGFTFLLSSCVKGQSLQMGLWDGWGSAQQLCWPTALPCCSTRRGRVVGTKVGPAWAGGGGAPPGQLCCQTPPVHSSGGDGAAVGQEEWAALIAEASVPSLPTC